MSLKVEGLSVSLGGRQLLRDINFEAGSGELLAIVGPNGAGKTTLLKAIAGLIEFRGTIDWNGKSLFGLKPSERARKLAYLPQGHVAHWPITAREVVTIGRAAYSSSLTRLQPADQLAIDDALEAVGVAELSDRPITQLSGGERARVMLARTLAVGAPLILADEPVASLDPAHQLSVMAILSKQARQGRLIVCVSHDLLLVARSASRFIVLDQGRIVSIGRYEEALDESVLSRVFGLETRQVSVDGTILNIPWQQSSAQK